MSSPLRNFYYKLLTNLYKKSKLHSIRLNLERKVMKKVFHNNKFNEVKVTPEGFAKYMKSQEELIKYAYTFL